MEHKIDNPASEARNWLKTLNSYRNSSSVRSVVELAITALPLTMLWCAAWLTYSLGYWWASLLIAIPASGFLIRMFMIQHDCGHGAFFPHRSANDWVGRIIGVVTMTPYDFWRRTHAIHHATSGNLDRRGIGDIDMFVMGPAYLFFLRNRLPLGLMQEGWRPWISTQATNAAIVLTAAVLIWLIGVQAFFLVHMPIMLLAATFGVWLFYVQHQFEDTFWNEGHIWNLPEAALHGSSHYDLPQPLRWFTANIGIHHVHHLCSRIPYYRLGRVLRQHPELRDIGRLTLPQSIRCIPLVLWDETQRRLVTFQEVRPQLETCS